MARTFDIGETVICSLEVKDINGNYTDPLTSMKIEITNPVGQAVVSTVNMAHDATGKYHYDYTSEASAVKGRYAIKYTATDDSRITIETDKFYLE